MVRIFRPKPGDEFKAERSYFHAERPPQIEARGSYATAADGKMETYCVWDHSLGGVINAVISAGLQIEFLPELLSTLVPRALS